jgi:hypothetical protein
MKEKQDISVNSWGKIGISFFAKYIEWKYFKQDCEIIL